MNNRLLRTFGTLKNRLLSRAIILMYHRVVEAETDPWSLCVTPGHFAEQLEVIRKIGHPARLSDLASSLQKGNVPDHAIAITFDDGYVDNLVQAKPILERFDTPATVFLVSGAIGQEREFWWDELERLLLSPDSLPETFHLAINGQVYTRRLSQGAGYSEAERHKDRAINPWEAAPGSRMEFFYSVWQQLLPLSLAERRRLLDEIAAWSGVDREGRSERRAFTPDEIASLVQGGLIEVGGHTVSHPFLPALSIPAQREEILRSKNEIESLTGRPVTSFAYPHGETTAATTALVKEAGYASACSIVAQCVYRKTHPYLLPRFAVQDWDGDEFARRLSDWFKFS